MTAAGSVVVLANPTAGDGKAGRLIGRVHAILDEIGVDHEIRVSGSARDLEDLARAAGEQGGIVAVLGGDGSVNLVVNGLFGTGATLAVLPAGTGDDFAKAIDAGKLDRATRLLADPKAVDVDLIAVTAGVDERWYINVAGTGFDSAVEEVAAGMRRRLGARGHYALATVKTLSRFVPAMFHLELDGGSLDVDAMLVVIGNSSAYGGGMKVLPQASIVDGELDVCIVSAMSKGAFMRAFPKVYLGKHSTHPNVTMLRGRGLKIEANRRMQVFADGERVGSLPAVFKVAPKALPVVMGPNARALR
ncbi:MAG: diacylglycerol/lipid kinase family protein [Actinomycetota bacterium]